MTAERITTNGRAWHDPQGGTTAWQREQERGELQPMERQYTGRWKALSWTLTLLVACIMWTAFFAWVLA